MPPREFLPAYIGLPEFDTYADLAEQLRISKRLLGCMIVRGEHFYRRFEIEKRSGGARIIAAPARSMKAVQAWILRRVLSKVVVGPHCTGFVCGRGLRSNLEPHVGNSQVLSIDIADYFGSVKWPQVRRVFLTLGYSVRMAQALANLCTYRGSLPQGGVTSPALANIVSMRLDRRIAGLAQKHNLAYTRYADDITISGTNAKVLLRALDTVRRILRAEGFLEHRGKTRVSGPGRRRLVTGLVLNDRGFGIGAVRARMLRAYMHSRLRQVAASPEERSVLAQAQGMLAYVNDVDPARALRLRVYIERRIASPAFGAADRQAELLRALGLSRRNGSLRETPIEGPRPGGQA